MKHKTERCECCGKFVPECTRCHLADDYITDMTEAWDVAICEFCFDKYPANEENKDYWRQWLVDYISKHPEQIQYGQVSE